MESIEGLGGLCIFRTLVYWTDCWTGAICSVEPRDFLYSAPENSHEDSGTLTVFQHLFIVCVLYFSMFGLLMISDLKKHLLPFKNIDCCYFSNRL